MNAWLYLPEYFYDSKVTRMLGGLINEVFVGVEDEVKNITKVGNVAEMPSDLLYEWLRLNNIQTTGSEELDRQIFKRYYSLLKRRGTLGSISRVIETGGSIYSDADKFYYKITRGVDLMMSYGRKYSNYKRFNPEMYCPGVFFIEITNLSAVRDNDLLDKVFPAGCKYYVIYVLLPKMIFMHYQSLNGWVVKDTHNYLEFPTRFSYKRETVNERDKLNTYVNLSNSVVEKSTVSFISVNDSISGMKAKDLMYNLNVDISIKDVYQTSDKSSLIESLFNTEVQYDVYKTSNVINDAIPVITFAESTHNVMMDLSVKDLQIINEVERNSDIQYADANTPSWAYMHVNDINQVGSIGPDIVVTGAQIKKE